MSGGVSVTYTARLDGIRLGVWGGPRRRRRRTPSRDALLHEGRRLIKGLGGGKRDELGGFPSSPCLKMGAGQGGRVSILKTRQGQKLRPLAFCVLQDGGGVPVSLGLAAAAR